MSIQTKHRDALGAIRHWENLTVATEDGHLWLKGFTQAQTQSVEVRCLPTQQYYLRERWLFPLDSLLPSRALPSLLWSPIDRALPLQLPVFNHHYFGLTEQLTARLVPSSVEQEACALLVSLPTLGHYLNTAPQVRLRPLRWVIMGNQALVMGTPLLPIVGTTFWHQDGFLFPTGYAPEFPLLTPVLATQLNPTGRDWIVWPAHRSPFLLAQTVLQELSIGSFRASVMLSHDDR